MKVALTRKHVHRHCCVTIEIIRICLETETIVSVDYMKGQKSANLTSVVFCFFPVRLPRPHIFLKPFNIRGSIQKELSCQKNKTEKAD